MNPDCPLEIFTPLIHARTDPGSEILGLSGFGTIAWSNEKDSELHGDRQYALASVLHDVLNRVVLDARLGRTNAYEVDLAVTHLAHTRAGDLLTMDRNYPSYRMLAELVQQQRDFVIRCLVASFGVADAERRRS